MSPLSKLTWLISLLSLSLTAQEIDFRGELAGFGQSGSPGTIASHYIPNLDTKYSLSPSLNIQAEASWHFNWFSPLDDLNTDLFHDEAYRLNLRLQTTQSELVLGLQKLNFGPGRILRPLMWFDQQDPSDPLGIARGVTGITLQHYTSNLIQFRAWLLEAGEAKGWESVAGKEGSLELGGRIALPILGGELGNSFHYRQPELPVTLFGDGQNPREFRYGLDGFIDIGIGFWFEFTTTRISNDDTNPISTQNMLMLGGDHTLGIGNGLHYSLEHFLLDLSAQAPAGFALPDLHDQYQFSAFMVDYPLGFFDQISLISLYDWENEKLTNLVSWRRSYDQWSFGLSAFSYPENSSSLTLGRTTQLSGDGIQLLVTFNH